MSTLDVEQCCALYRARLAFIPYYDYCDWCWWWGRLYAPEEIEPLQLICEGCIFTISERLEDGADLAELRPPWQPDGRARRANELSKIAALAKLPTDAVAKIAAFEVGQWRP